MKLPESVKIALDTLSSHGFEAFVVGGCVRDYIRKTTPTDYDITTPSTPDETKAVFKDFPVFLQGKKHGTVGVIINGEKLEITTHRQDGEYIDHRRPETVSFSRSLRDDLSRRDFTVNAIAWSEKSGIVDLFGGTCDIEKKIIRCVGDPDRRFDEDALRILRALRFSATLGFEIEENTSASIFKNAHLLRGVSAERVREEIEKLSLGDRRLEVFEKYQSVMEILLGEIDTSPLSRFGKGVAGRDFLGLVFSLTDGQCIDKLKFSNREKSFYKGVRTLFCSAPPKSDYDVKKAVSVYGTHTVSSFLKITDLGLLNRFNELSEAGELLEKKDLAINGTRLNELGIPQGRETGIALDRLFELVLQGKIENNTESIEIYVKAQML